MLQQTSFGDARFKKPLPNSLTSVFGQHRHAQATAMGYRMRPGREDVRPTNHAIVCNGHELRRAVRYALSHECLDPLKWRRLDLREVTLLAGDHVQALPKAGGMILGDGNNTRVHEASL